MFLDCNWSISVQLIPNKRAKICNKSAKIMQLTTGEPIRFQVGRREYKSSIYTYNVEQIKN